MGPISQDSTWGQHPGVYAVTPLPTHHELESLPRAGPLNVPLRAPSLKLIALSFHMSGP